MGRLLMVAVLVAGCGGGPTAGGGTQAPNRCVSVSAELVDAIETGLTVSGGGTLGAAQAVKSNDFEQAWFVAAEIRGPSLDEVGVWATNGLTAGDGLIFAADGFAKEFSDWGDGPGFSIADDGAQEAKNCVR